MSKYILYFATFCLIAVSSLSAKQPMTLYNNGLASPNEYSGELPQELVDWCEGRCFPTTQLEVSDPAKPNKTGIGYVWARDFVNGSDGSICFSEFILFNFTEGDIYVAGLEGRTCGAFIDPAIISPISDPNAVVLAGGGDGKIVGGTRGFKKWIGGGFTDRVFVEFLNNNIHYYQSLIFILVPPENLDLIGQ